MKIVTLFIAAMVCFSTIPGAGHAGNDVKIGIVDFQRILQKSKYGQDIQREINEKGERLKSELMDQQNKIKEMQEKYNREAVVLSSEQKTQKEQEIRAELNAYGAMQRQNTQAFNTVRSELINDAKQKIIDLSQEIGRANGYTLIIEKQSGMVLYAKDPLDITDRFEGGIDKK